MKKDRVVIFGAAGTGQKIYKKIKDTSNVICFAENNRELWGTKVDGIPVIPPDDILNINYDCIHIGSMCGMDDIVTQLVSMGIPSYRLVKDVALVQTRSRVLFLERAAELIYQENIKGAVAEVGVFKGAFSKEINRLFPDRKLYLFDTFEGFSDADIKEEVKESMTSADYLRETSAEMVLEIMPNRQNCKVCKGYFPETAAEINDIFSFVSLDTDLYKPTLEGLRFFYPRMETGGMISIHDYFSDAYPNIKTAVADFHDEIEGRMHMSPIGDDLSIVIVK